MKKSLILAATLLASNTAFAVTDHYVLRDGNHVQHLKITKIDGHITASADVNFEPNANEANAKACSGEVSGEGKMTEENVLVFKQHSGSEANSCVLTVQLSPTGAKIEQSKHCDNFVTGICRFSSNGKELVKFQ
jgi:hypothetical protein